MRNPTSPRPRGGARGDAGAVCAVHAAGPARHLPGEELAGGIHPQPVREDVPVGEHRKLPAGAAHAQAAPMEPPEDPLALLCVLSTRREQNGHQFLSRLLTPTDHDF